MLSMELLIKFQFPEDTKLLINIFFSLYLTLNRIRLMDIKTYKIQKPEEMNFILGQAHFIKTVEDIHETIVNINPGIKFGVAFCEASQKALVRFSGNDDDCIKLAQENAKNIACGHCFIIFLANAFPLNILNSIKTVPEVVRIFCATANETEVIIAETELGRGILGVVDGVKTNGIETEEDIAERKEFLRTIGYKF
jgi:adenosine/AMP kinase